MTTVKQLQNILRLTFGIVPIVAGLDKFTNILTHWPDYLGVNLTALLPISVMAFMKIVGVIEIVAGIIVLVRPLAGAYIVMAWLVCIALQLIAGGHYFDVAVRDLVMAMGAFTLAKLTIITSSEFRPIMQH
ncbi:MAG TPA: hypothetical protein VGI38_08935 [Puia sp.]